MSSIENKLEIDAFSIPMFVEYWTPQVERTAHFEEGYAPQDTEGELEMKMLMSDIQRRVPDDVVLEHGLEEVRVILFEEYDKYKSVRKSQQVKK